MPFLYWGNFLPPDINDAERAAAGAILRALSISMQRHGNGRTLLVVSRTMNDLRDLTA